MPNNISPVHSSTRATLIGSTAVLMWATLALLTAWSGPIPPFQLMAMSFAIAFCIGVGLWLRKGQGMLIHLRLPWRVWLLGISGLFGYHFFYFVALQNAPTVEASLIAYLWPLLIVLLAALLPGARLRWFHVAGALLGFAGAGLLVTRGQSFSFDAAYSLGYGAALVCALTWSSYSVLSRKFGAIPTDAVGGFCGATALLALLCHWAFEETVRPVGAQWGAILGLGLGPVGAAFFTWDVGVKRGNITLLGVFSYAAPLLSTLLLAAAGVTPWGWLIGAACLLITSGALLASLDLLVRPRTTPTLQAPAARHKAPEAE